MGWDGFEIKDGQSEIEAILEFIEDDRTKCVAHSYDDESGVYYLALKNGDDVYAKVASTRSYNGEIEDGWLYVKFIHEGAVPIHTNPSKEVLNALTAMGDDYNYEWRELAGWSKDNQ